MPNYNSQLQSNNIDLQTVLQTLQTKAAGGGSGNGYEEIDNLITRTITSYTNSRISHVGPYAFYSCRSLTTVNFPACTSINSNAFNYCSSLTTASFPVCSTIGFSAFQGCSNLTTISFPVCTSIYRCAFESCSSLITANFPVCTSIGANAFYRCNSLATVNFPVCTSIGNNAFYSCYNLTTVDFPACKTIDNYAFHYCSSLTTANFPVCMRIGYNAFNNCISLTTASFSACRAIDNEAFLGCCNLSQLYLTGSSLCNLSNSNAFTSTPYAGYSASFSGTPYIYVPQSLLTSYKIATNWTYFSKYFSAIEGGDIGDNTANIITFTIGNTEYQAEEGMTWEEWFYSNYNTSNWIINGHNIYDNSGAILASVNKGGGTVQTTDLISESDYYSFGNY